MFNNFEVYVLVVSLLFVVGCSTVALLEAEKSNFAAAIAYLIGAIFYSALIVLNFTIHQHELLWDLARNCGGAIFLAFVVRKKFPNLQRS